MMAFSIPFMFWANASMNDSYAMSLKTDLLKWARGQSSSPPAQYSGAEVRHIGVFIKTYGTMPPANQPLSHGFVQDMQSLDDFEIVGVRPVPPGRVFLFCGMWLAIFGSGAVLLDVVRFAAKWCPESASVPAPVLASSPVKLGVGGSTSKLGTGSKTLADIEMEVAAAAVNPSVPKKQAARPVAKPPAQAPSTVPPVTPKSVSDLDKELKLGGDI